MYSDEIQAKIFEATEENIKLCAEYINQGKIIGMPTETVYGLAANAFDIEAVKNIFIYKGRPLSDPLIVHVTSIEMANDLIDIDEDTKYLFTLLANKYWPGPLTLVLKGNFNKISRTLTANTDYIGIRFPNNKIAQDLINASNCPLAAPSANKFCHISPVNPIHVYDDFKEYPIYILDGGVCNYCMESSVVKIITENGNKIIQILRMGAISPENFKEFLKEKGLTDIKIEILCKSVKLINPEIETNIKIEENDSIEAPGQFLKHYSPLLETYIFSTGDIDNNNSINKYSFKEINYNNSLKSQIVVIDYKNTIKNIAKDKFQYYLELSGKGDAEEVMHNLYNFLRKAEIIENAKIIIICDLEEIMNDSEHKLTLVDRIQKASSFKKLKIIFNK
jgi:tRNA threonylcarbamoyl adenosine modification protein (Sua5/YciO/YrdC/YwlC family)